ncbi:hypothetical protein DIPPA_25030 [Diplonema papillatum]|nr:hypothetical protein DIPPA_25030 [Diplonema papillatum]
MHKYKLLGKKGEGTFSAVLKAQCMATDRSVAIKCMKNQFECVDQVNRLREIQALRRLSPHPNIIKLFEVLYDRSTGRLALVFELMEMDLYELIKERKQYLPDDRVLHIMYQLMRAMEHMHRNAIFHRDIKPENVLVSGDTLKLADFGSCRGIYSRQPFTEYIATRWYRAPECLLTDGYYNYKMDMWGAGCVFFEIVALYPLFPGTNEMDQLHKIHKVLGTPSARVLDKLRQNSSHRDTDFPPEAGLSISELITHASPEAVDIITALLEYDPDERISAKKAVRHAYFKDIRDLDRQLRAQAKQADKHDRERAADREKAVGHDVLLQPNSNSKHESGSDAARTPPSSSATPSLTAVTTIPHLEHCQPASSSHLAPVGDHSSNMLPSLHFGSSITGRSHEPQQEHQQLPHEAAGTHGNYGHGASHRQLQAVGEHPQIVSSSSMTTLPRKTTKREREQNREHNREREKERDDHLPSIEASNPRHSNKELSGRKQSSVDCLTSLSKQHMMR